jgi:hypothetical protein
VNKTKTVWLLFGASSVLATGALICFTIAAIEILKM